MANVHKIDIMEYVGSRVHFCGDGTMFYVQNRLGRFAFQRKPHATTPVPVKEERNLAVLVKNYLARQELIKPKTGNFTVFDEAGLRKSLKIPAETELYLAWDFSFSKNGKYGCAFTESGIYGHIGFERAVFISWEEFMQAKLIREPVFSDMSLWIWQGRSKFPKHILYKGERKESGQLYHMICDLQTCLRNCPAECFTAPKPVEEEKPSGRCFNLGRGYYLAYREKANGFGGYCYVSACLYKGKKCIRRITDDNGCFLNFPGAEHGEWEKELAFSFEPVTRFPFSYNCFNEKGLAEFVWMVQPDGRYWEDEDGFGGEKDSEIKLYAFFDETGQFVAPFHEKKKK